MSKFEDDLRQSIPGVSQGCITALESAYGHSTGFCAGLDIFARIIIKNAPAKQIPAFGEPWKGLYQDMMQICQTGNGSLWDAYQSALMMAGRPVLALHEAVSLRTNILSNQTSKTKVKTSDDYKAQLSILGFDLRLNLAGNKIEVNGKVKTDFDDAMMRAKMFDAGFDKKTMVEDSILNCAKDNEYHPIREYLKSLTWDGTKRISTLANYFQVAYKPIWPSLLRKWLIGSVDRVMTGAQNPMLVLDGPQGVGKSLFARWLCPREDYFREGPINPDDRDDKIATSETWIWEVAELGSTTRRSDREALKNFLTTKSFTARAPYGHNNLQYEAIATFIGTINDEAGFLNDPTGNRRFWIMTVDGINWKYTEDLNIDDIWAEVYAAWLAGESHDLDDAEKKTMGNIDSAYQVINSVEEAIKAYFIINPKSSDFTSFKDIRSVLRDPNRGNLSPAECSDRKIANALKSLGLERAERQITNVGLGSSSRTHLRGYVGIKPL